MIRGNQYSKKQPLMEQLQAFNLFRKEGMKAVERMFPEHKAFVEANKKKSYNEVKQELITASHTV
jgi:hypothetical protein